LPNLWGKRGGKRGGSLTGVKPVGRFHPEVYQRGSDDKLQRKERGNYFVDGRGKDAK